MHVCRFMYVSASAYRGQMCQIPMELQIHAVVWPVGLGSFGRVVHTLCCVQKCWAISPVSTSFYFILSFICFGVGVWAKDLTNTQDMLCHQNYTSRDKTFKWTFRHFSSPLPIFPFLAKSVTYSQSSGFYVVFAYLPFPEHRQNAGATCHLCWWQMILGIRKQKDRQAQSSAHAALC